MRWYALSVYVCRGGISLVVLSLSVLICADYSQLSSVSAQTRPLPPHIYPASGSYTNDVTVTIYDGSCTPTACTGYMPKASEFRYTTDGTEPTASSALYDPRSPITIASPTTLKVKGFYYPAGVDGGVGSDTSSVTYSFVVATPTLSPASGTYTAAQTVTLTPVTSGATIRYTIDGSTPTQASALYTGPLSIATQTTVTAKAFKTSYTDSAIASAAYAFNYGTLPAPTISPGTNTYNNDVSVTLSSQPGATIRYTLDGTDPTTTSPLYSGPLNIASAATLKAKAFHPDYPTSAIASATYTFAAAAPTFSPPAGTYTTAQTVTLATPTSGATIRYTTDGSTPTTSSAQYTGPIAVNTQTTLSAKTFKSGYADSAAASAVYTLNYGTLPAPTMSPGTNTYSNDVSVTLSSSQTGATIRYTLDGSDPTASSPLYGGPLTITSSTTVKAKAFHPDYAMSPTASETYTFVATTPTLSPAAGTYTSAQNVTMTTATNGATIRYTTDGSTPTAASTQYTGPIAINTQTTVSAKAFRTGYTDSAAANALYAFNYGTLATPTAAPAPGLFTPPVTVTLSGPAGATIRYTTDGSDPVDTSPVYTTALTLSQTTTLKARAFQVDWIPSAVLTAVYTIQSDITPPTIVAIVNPGPNAAGWNQTPVTVSFICKDDTEVASCPAPVAITTETDGQVVTGQVTDTAGNTATASVTVRIDMTPPTVTLMTPTMDFSTTDTQVQVLASASDSRSGVRDAMCSLASSSITGGTIGCSVPLGKGQNPVIVQVTDVAGNSASAAVQVTRTGTPSSLIISPATLTLLVDDELSLQVQDDLATLRAAR